MLSSKPARGWSIATTCPPSVSKRWQRSRPTKLAPPDTTRRYPEVPRMGANLWRAPVSGTPHVGVRPMVDKPPRRSVGEVTVDPGVLDPDGEPSLRLTLFGRLFIALLVLA